MTVTNTDKDATDDSAAVIETDLHKLKYPDGDVGTTPKVEDETPEDEELDGKDEDNTDEEDDGQQPDDSTPGEDDEDENPDDKPSFIKGFENIKGDTPEEYIKNLEAAYGNSTSEAMRLKKLAEARTAAPPPQVGDDDDDDSPVSPPAPVSSDPTQLWISQQMDKEILKAYDSFKSDYSQVEDPEMYDKFTAEVSVFSQIEQAKGLMPDPADLYRRAAVSLGWEKTSKPSDKEKLGAALKTNAASSPAKTSGAKPPVKSKVTDEQVAAYRQTARDGHSLSDAEIRKELEQYVT